MVTVADIGATKTVVAAARRVGNRIELSSERRCESKDFGSFETVLEEYFRGRNLAPSGSLCIGVAGPVMENKCDITNLSWSLDGAAIAEKFGFDRVVLLNDLEVSGYGIDWLPDSAFEIINAGQPANEGNRLLVSPGTGLGESIIHFVGGRYVPVASEGGHADFAPVDGTTVRLWEFVRRNRACVSVEDVLSGPGFSNIFNFLLSEAGVEPDEKLKADLSRDAGSAVVTRAAEGSDELAITAVKIFFDILAAETGNMALRGMATAGVYIGGGIVPRMITLLDKNRYMEIFARKNKHRQLLKKIPIRIITDTALPLYGAAAYLSALTS